jgi:hypothetical protein
VFPACCGPTQTALLNLNSCSQYFEQIKRNDVRYVRVPSAEGNVHLAIDSDFYDLTPLNTPEDPIYAEYVSLDI